MRAGPAFLQFDWSKAGLSMDFTGLRIFPYEDWLQVLSIQGRYRELFMCLEIFDFKPRRKNLTGLLFCLDLFKSVKVY